MNTVHTPLPSYKSILSAAIKLHHKALSQSKKTMLLYSDKPNDSTFQQGHQVDKNTPPSSIECRACVQDKSISAPMAIHIKLVMAKRTKRRNHYLYNDSCVNPSICRIQLTVGLDQNTTYSTDLARPATN